MKNRPQRVFIGLGSNVGNRQGFIEASVQGMKELPRTKWMGLSPLYETSALGPRQRMFLNAVAEIQTTLSPRVLLRRLKDLEGLLGRRRRRRWGPREIDLDILFYGRKYLKTKGLAIPHPQIPKRKFVLYPFSDLAPTVRHPHLKKTVARLKDELTSPGQRIRLFKKIRKREN